MTATPLMARVGDLSDQIRGVTYSKSDAVENARPGFKPVLRANSITDTGLMFDDLVFVPESKIGKQQFVRANDIVIAASSGSIDVVGKAARALTDFDGGFGAFCKVLRPNGKVDPAYFAHFFSTQAYRRRVSELAAGANINNLKNEHLNDLEIPLPPLPEQRRIAAILDKADALRAKRREAIVKLDQLMQSVFLDMFGDPVTNPKSLPICALREVTFFQEGPGILAKDFRDHGIPLVRLSGVKDSDRVTLSGCNYLDPAMVEKKWKHFRLTKGDIVILTSASLGHAAVVDDEAEGAIPYTGIIRLRPISSSLSPGFLKAYLTSQWFSRQAQAMASGAVIKHFGPTHIKEMTIPMPNLSVQERYAEIAANIGERRVQLMNAKSANESLFQSLQRDAFSGGLAL